MIIANIGLPSSDQDVSLNVVVYKPVGTEFKGVIQIVHGMTEHMRRYEEFGEYFTSKGYIVTGNDIISHGKSKHRKTEGLYFKDWFDAVKDVESVREYISKTYPGLPIYIIGFSLGSFLVRSLPNLDAYEKEILIGTGTQPSILLKLLKKSISGDNWYMLTPSEKVKSLAFDSYNKQFKGEPDNFWLLTGEKERKEYETDKLVNTSITPGFFSEFLTGMIYTNKKMKCPNNYGTPTMFLYGTDDPVSGCGKGIQKVYKAYKKFNEDTVIYCVPYKTHDVLHDHGYLNVFEKIESFIH